MVANAFLCSALNIFEWRTSVYGWCLSLCAECLAHCACAIQFFFLLVPTCRWIDLAMRNAMCIFRSAWGKNMQLQNFDLLLYLKYKNVYTWNSIVFSNQIAAFTVFYIRFSTAACAVCTPAQIFTCKCHDAFMHCPPFLCSMSIIKCRYISSSFRNSKYDIKTHWIYHQYPHLTHNMGRWALFCGKIQFIVKFTSKNYLKFLKNVYIQKNLRKFKGQCQSVEMCPI